MPSLRRRQYGRLRVIVHKYDDLNQGPWHAIHSCFAMTERDKP